jgi:hypothetical protein
VYAVSCAGRWVIRPVAVPADTECGSIIPRRRYDGLYPTAKEPVRSRRSRGHTGSVGGRVRPSYRRRGMMRMNQPWCGMCHEPTMRGVEGERDGTTWQRLYTSVLVKLGAQLVTHLPATIFKLNRRRHRAPIPVAARHFTRAVAASKGGACMVGTYAQTARSNAGPGDGLTPASRCQLIITAPVLARRGASGSAAGWWVVVRAGVRQTRRRWWDGWAIGGGRLATTMANGRGARRCRCWRRAYSMAVSDHSRPTSR